MMQRTEGVLAVPDPDLEMGGAVIQTLRQGGEDRSPKKFFSAPRASVWSKNKGRGAGPSPRPLP